MTVLLHCIATSRHFWLTEDNQARAVGTADFDIGLSELYNIIYQGGKKPWI